MALIPVPLAERAYAVEVGRGLIGGAGERVAALAPYTRGAIVSDEVVARLYGAQLQASLAAAGLASDLIVYPPGEETKSFDLLADLCDRLLGLGIDRKGVVVALGGGVIGDLAGFAAAIVMRGVDYVQVPTTLLAQVDSSVGGKTAIDTPRGKNLVGAFHQPRLVLADLDVLSSLPARQLRAGYAEVLKYGLLGDADFFAWMEANGPHILALQPEAIEHAVSRSIAMKAEIVVADERETSGRRALLNLGHTFGHALEVEVGFGERLLHGEAVAVGCAMAFRFSARLGLCSPDAPPRVESALRAVGLPWTLAALELGAFSAAALVDRMRGDKKAEGSRLSFVLARSIGDALFARDIDQADVLEFLRAEGAEA